MKPRIIFAERQERKPKRVVITHGTHDDRMWTVASLTREEARRLIRDIEREIRHLWVTS